MRKIEGLALQHPQLDALAREAREYMGDHELHIKQAHVDVLRSMADDAAKQAKKLERAAAAPKKTPEQQAAADAEAAAKAVLEKKNPKRQAAARVAAEASHERRREIHSGVATNLPQELQTAWAKEGHKFMKQEAGRIRGVEDRLTAASKISEAFAEQYGGGDGTTHGGDRHHKISEIEAKHAEEWANEQERRYYEQAARSQPSPSRTRHDEHDTWAGDPPKVVDDDDPPF